MRAISYSDNLCEVCGEKSTGQHFGANTCRACAAFFRRSLSWKTAKECRKGNGKCMILSTNGFFICKKCRLQKCLDVGMVADKSQIDQSAYENHLVIAKRTIPSTVGSLLGSPNFIIFQSRPQLFNDRPRSFVDVKFLMQKAMFILEQGVASPIHSKTTLGKLAMGLRRVQDRYQMKDIRLMKTFGKEDTLVQWEFEFLKLINWLTYFDGFRQLPKCLQISMAKNIWNVWNRLLFLAEAVAKCKELFGEEETKRMARDTLIFDWSHVEFDLSWCSSYPIEQIRCFLDIPAQWRIDDMVRMMVDLNPTDVELSYMLCQMSFHYINKRHETGVHDLIDKFQENLANDLHHYYVEELDKPKYAERLTSMMKLNTRLQQKIRENKTKIEMAVIFEIVNCECSHPEMFTDVC